MICRYVRWPDISLAISSAGNTVTLFYPALHPYLGYLPLSDRTCEYNPDRPVDPTVLAYSVS